MLYLNYIGIFTCCIIKAMTRRTVIARLRKHRAQLTQLGVKSLSLFGSVARGEERSDSDVDILVEFKGKATFDRYMDTKFYLEDVLGCKVDLVTPQAIKPRMKAYIMRDLVHVA
jgi:predicted nucleotidyltransferase